MPRAEISRVGQNITAPNLIEARYEGFLPFARVTRRFRQIELSEQLDRMATSIQNLPNMSIEQIVNIDGDRRVRAIQTPSNYNVDLQVIESRGIITRYPDRGSQQRYKDRIEMALEGDQTFLSTVINTIRNINFRF